MSLTLDQPGPVNPAAALNTSTRRDQNSLPVKAERGLERGSGDHTRGPQISDTLFTFERGPITAERLTPEIRKLSHALTIEAVRLGATVTSLGLFAGAAFAAWNGVGAIADKFLLGSSAISDMAIIGWHVAALALGVGFMKLNSLMEGTSEKHR